MADVKRILALLLQLAIVHAGLEGVGPALLQACIVVVLPSQSLVNIGVVFNELTDCHLSKFSLKPDILVLASRLGSHTVHLDALS